MRSREEQIKALAVSLMDEGGGKNASYAFAQEVIDEAVQLGRELERAEMGRDTKRLDYLERTFILMALVKGPTPVPLDKPIDEVFTQTGGIPFRAAIDAAMNAGNGNG